MKPIVIFCVVVVSSVCVAAAEPIELKQAGSDNYHVMTGKKDLVELMPGNWQGNLNIFSTKNKTMCGVNWPHFLLYVEGGWLTDKVESEGMNLVEFKPLETSGPVIGYSGKWKFRDYCISSESHFIWYDATNATQVHLVRAQLEILKDLPVISSTWVEFMTQHNSYTMIAAKTKGGQIVTLDLSKTAPNTSRHYLDGLEFDDNSWITIYGARKGQDNCVAMIPIKSSGTVRPRINVEHVDNIELHMLDARKSNFLSKGRTFSLEYLLIVGPDQKDWKWIDLAIQNARTFMTNNAALLEPMATAH